MRKLTIQDMQAIAAKKGGECLSTEYVNANKDLKWQCSAGHVWLARPGNIQQDKWCPSCSAGLSERICRKFFEILFKKEFPRARPKWLAGFKNRSLEFDGYCKELGLAFEYHGEQHFQENRRFHERIALTQRKEYDELKRERCKQNNVVLGY